MKKKGLLSAVAMAGVLSFSIPAFALATAEQARETAQAYVPDKSAHIQTEDEDGKYEVKFYNRDREEWYELYVDKYAGKAVSFKSELMDDNGGRTVAITEEQAKKAVTDEIAKAEILAVVQKVDDGLTEYKVTFQSDACYGEYLIHPESGKVLERHVKFGTPPQKDTQGTASAGSGYIGQDKAAEIAQAKAPGAALKKCKLDFENGRPVYEGELRSGNWEYEFEIDALTGEILSWDQDWDD